MLLEPEGKGYEIKELHLFGLNRARKALKTPCSRLHPVCVARALMSINLRLSTVIAGKMNHLLIFSVFKSNKNNLNQEEQNFVRNLNRKEDVVSVERLKETSISFIGDRLMPLVNN